MQRTLHLQRAEEFRQLHNLGQPLLLVNAWDAASARLLESSGVRAIATTSAAMAWSLGYPDGERMPSAELIVACERICRIVNIPVSVDIEGGFGETIADVCANMRALLHIGVVGINIEDGVDSRTGNLHSSSRLAARITAIRAVADQAGVPLFINARIDTWFAPRLEPASRYDETMARAQAYIDSGADGIFVPGVDDIDEIARLSRTIPRPLNIYVGRNTPSVAALARVNVRRVSLGCGPSQAALALTRRIVKEALEHGTYSAMTSDMLSVGEANAWFTAPN